MDDVSKTGAHVAVCVDNEGDFFEKVRGCVCERVIALPLWVYRRRDSKQGRHSQCNAQSDKTNPPYK